MYMKANDYTNDAEGLVSALCAEVNAVRRANRVKIVDISARTGISPPHISSILHGKMRPTALTLARIAVAAGVRLRAEAAEE